MEFSHTGSLTGQGFLHTDAAEHRAFSPSRARSARYWTFGPDGTAAPSASDVIETLRLGEAKVPLDPGATLLIEQSAPFGMFTVAFRNSGLRVFGVYSEHQDVLVLTDVDNYDVVLESTKRSGRAADKSWVYRFRNYESGSFVLNTRRLCSRWASWKNSSLPTSAERFAVLESRLFSTSTEDACTR